MYLAMALYRHKETNSYSVLHLAMLQVRMNPENLRLVSAQFVNIPDSSKVNYEKVLSYIAGSLQPLTLQQQQQQQQQQHKQQPQQNQQYQSYATATSVYKNIICRTNFYELQCINYNVLKQTYYLNISLLIHSLLILIFITIIIDIVTFSRLEIL